MLVWDQYEFIECLGVLPEVEEYETSHSFTIEKDDLRLEITIFQDAGDLYVDLYRNGIEASVFKARVTNCPGARRVKNINNPDYLEFAAAKVFGSRYDGESVIPMGVRIWIEPHIRIEMF